MGTVTCIRCRRPVLVTPTGLVCECGTSLAAERFPDGKLLPLPPKEAA